MSFSKTLVAFLSVLTIIPGAAIKAVNANVASKDLSNIDIECVNYMITSDGETICLDSESPVESEPPISESSADLECSLELTAEVETQSEPVAEIASSTESIEEVEPSSAAEPAVEEEEPAAESNTAEEASPETLADAACSPESSSEDLEPVP